MSVYESLFANDQDYTRISSNQFPKQGLFLEDEMQDKLIPKSLFYYSSGFDNKLTYFPQFFYLCKLSLMFTV